ncbi:hypothetical protein OED01_15550 [Microbacterium sp. M28]|uniref:hypothetical protein n=1 Tax=Microbacterium sp. M28 TaxID=2962064 RepID=UPI0021F3E12D|nr:hypothetical protein [Microbacterium sp. M28]UYO96995.1 hypothetical protein OED01_15550 [Microbacterium sp. M28]
MNATNRVVNRVVLVAAALVLGAGGAALLLYGAGWAWAEPVRDGVDAAVAGASDLLGGASVAVADDRRIPVAALLVAGAGLILVALAVIFIATRGGGRSSTVLSAREAGGVTSADANIVRAIVDDAIGRRSDVIAGHTDVHIVRGEPVVRVRVRPRRGADLVGVVASVAAAIDEWAVLRGTRMPVLLHLSELRVVDRLRSTTRVR